MAKKSHKKELHTKIFLVVVVIIFMVSSIASVVLYRNSDEDNSFTYDTSSGKYKFDRRTDTNGNFYLEISAQDRKFLGYYLPDALTLSISNQTKDIIKNAKYFYLSFDPESEEISFMDYLRFDMKKNIPSTKFFIDSVAKQSETYPLPVITCENATDTVPVISIRSVNATTKIDSAGNCVNIEFNKLSALRIRDALVYLVNDIDVR